MTRRDHELKLFNDVFPDNCNGLLVSVPEWCRVAIARRIKQGSVTFVSAVCPDYERQNGHFTYRALGEGLPFTAEQHLVVMQAVSQRLSTFGVQLNYHVTLADTEFDLPLVVQALASGDSQEFLRRCERSCRAILGSARERTIPIVSCSRFTDVFQRWFQYYEAGLDQLRRQALTTRSVSTDLEYNAAARFALYRAMAGQAVSEDYCRTMVLRQWAQYAAWGECATQVFGEDIVMMNHTTPNLSYVNHQFFRAGRPRIPIIQLSITTMPG